jgi:hypothetical protein
MNENTSPTARRFPWRRRPRLFQDLLFHLQRAHLRAQLAQLLALICGEPLALALVDLSLLSPHIQRLLRDAEVLGDLG